MTRSCAFARSSRRSRPGASRPETFTISIKSREKRKLKLRKERLKPLSDNELDKAHGGMLGINPIRTEDCTPSCNGCVQTHMC